MSDKQNQIFDEIHEECGVFGMYDLDGGEVASMVYLPCSTEDRKAVVSQSAIRKDQKER